MLHKTCIVSGYNTLFWVTVYIVPNLNYISGCFTKSCSCPFELTQEKHGHGHGHDMVIRQSNSLKT